MLSLATAFLLNNMWTLLLGVAFIFNVKQHQDNKPVIYTNLILVLGFALPSILYVQYVVDIKPLLPVYYLYWAAINAMIIVFICTIIKLRKWPFYAGIKLVLICLAVDVVFNLLVHIDRNILALNGHELPNTTRQSAWALWAIRNAFSNISNGAMLLGVIAPFKLGLKGVSAVFKQLLNAIDFKRYKQDHNISNRLETIDLMKQQSKNECAATEYHNAAKELTYRSDETQTDFTNAIGLLLDAAAHEALQPHPKQTHSAIPNRN
jgi:hypothetical protein